MTFRWDPLPTNNPYEDRFQRTIYASQLFFDSLQSKNYVAGASGFRIDVDGTAEFASGVTLGPGAITIAADLTSQNFVQATNPGVSGDGTGWKIDYDADTAYFGTTYIDGSLGVGGNITTAGSITANGTITGNAQWNMNDTINFGSSGELRTDNSIPYVRIWEPGAVGGEIAWVRNAGDTDDPKIYVDDDRMYIRAREDSGSNFAPLISLTREALAPTSSLAGIGTGGTGVNLNSHVFHGSDYIGGIPAQKFETGTNFSKTALGTGTPAFQFVSNGDAQGFEFDADPTTTETHTTWKHNGTAFAEINDDDQFAFDYGTVSLPGITFKGDEDTGLYRYGSNVIGFTAGANNRVAIHSDGFAVEDDDRALPHWAHFTESDGSPASASTWTQIGSNRIAWDHNGTNRAVRVAIHFACFAQNTGGTNRIMAMRIRYSLDGGATWTAAGEQHTVAGNAAGGAQRQAMSKTVIVSGTCTGDLLVQFQAWRDGAITGNFRNISYSTQTLGLL
ncbi:hypothetical protein [Porticoccus sp.]